MISANLVFRVIVYAVSPSIGLSTMRCCRPVQHHRKTAGVLNRHSSNAKDLRAMKLGLSNITLPEQM